MVTEHAEIAARLDELAQEWLQGQHTPEWYIGDATVADWRDAYRAVAYDMTMKLGARNTEAEMIIAQTALTTPTATATCNHASESGGICVLREGHPEGRHRNGVDAAWGLTHDTPDSDYVREWSVQPTPQATPPTATAREGGEG